MIPMDYPVSKTLIATVSAHVRHSLQMSGRAVLHELMRGGASMSQSRHLWGYYAAALRPEVIMAVGKVCCRTESMAY